MRLDAEVDRKKRNRKRKRDETVESEESDVEPSTSKKTNVGLEILLSELPLSDGDEDDEFSLGGASEVEVIAPTPVKKIASVVNRNSKPDTKDDEYEVEEECEDEGLASDSENDKDDALGTDVEDFEIDEVDKDDEDDDFDEEDSEDDGDEDLQDFETLKSYYSKGKAKTVREKLLVMFYDYLINLLGGCKKERQSHTPRTTYSNSLFSS